MVRPAPKRHEAPIIVIGPMAAGKTHVGGLLAERSGRPFVDADRLIVNRHGPIPELFRQGGEEHFRRIESETILEVLSNPLYEGSVFSLGGGAPMTPAIREALSELTVIYLDVDVETVRPRIADRTDRPLLAEDPVGRWVAIHAERSTVYEAVADVVVDGRGRHRPEEMVDRIIEALPHLFVPAEPAEETPTVQIARSTTVRPQDQVGAQNAPGEKNASENQNTSSSQEQS